MNNKLLCLITALLTVFSITFLVGCGGGNGGGISKPRYNDDVEIVLPEDITTEHFITEEDVTYYTSPGLSLMMEVNGAFFKMDYFYLDENKRVYDNLYFYVDDYFYMITSNYKDIYASLSDTNDTEFAEEEKEQGYDIQLNVKKAGIYKLIFDVDTLKFDLIYKAEIETPIYYTIKNCQIYTKTTKWVDMNINPNNPDEFVINNFSIADGEYIYFQDRTHTSLYKTTLDKSCMDTYASYSHPSTAINVGGSYNVYINAKTYVVRLELTNFDTATYNCVYYDGNDFIKLQPHDDSIPYVFRQRITVDTKNTTSLPKFYTENYKTYKLKVVDNSNLLSFSGKYYYFKNVGVYDLIVNLKTFEVAVELLPE